MTKKAKSKTKKSATRKILTLHVSYLGAVVAVLFFCLSLTPSLLPRATVMQGVVSGITAVFGYGIGTLISWTWRYLQLPEPKANLKRNIKRYSLVVGVIAVFWFLWQHGSWNDTGREAVGLEPLHDAQPLVVFLIAGIVFDIFLIISRSVYKLGTAASNYLRKKINPRLAKVLAVTLTSLLVLFLINGVLRDGAVSVANSIFSVRDSETNEGITQPETNFRSGGPNSSVTWDSLGRQGRAFTGGGPTVDDLNEYSRGGAIEPIRVYAGLKSADTIQGRADLILEDLVAMDAFDREVLVVTTTTGTGWLDPNAMDTLEYMFNGDTAIVGAQYSYLPSWISLFVDQQITKDTANTVFNTVHSYWTTLPENDRPELHIFGLSLGAFGSQTIVQSVNSLNDPIDGALWGGPPFMSELWSDITHNRDIGSPDWRPVYEEGVVVRFTGMENSLDEPVGAWDGTRLVYLQHPTDPIVFFSPGLMFNEPDWLVGERGEGVSPDMDWYPFVTFWQVAMDLANSTGVPDGYGHSYSKSGYINVWDAITQPEGWNDEAVQDLKEYFDSLEE